MMRATLIIASIAVLAFRCSSSQALTRFDFEDGTLQGWTIVSGSAGKLPTGPETSRRGVPFNQQGNYFIGLYENPERDAATIVLRSPTFKVMSNVISLLVGGGRHPNSTYIALYKASDSSEIARLTGINNEGMTRRYLDVTKLRGQEVYFKIVDAETGGWGHINVDDIRELTSNEERDYRAYQAIRKNRTALWERTVDSPSSRIVYKGKSLEDVAFPLGAIGGGHLSLCGDGVVREWNIFSRANDGCFVPNSFFAVRAKARGKPGVARVLQQSPLGKLPVVDSIEFIGEYPIAFVDYLGKDLPVRVSLRAFSPFIPMNERDSAIPTAIFEFTITNPTSEPVEVSLLGSLQNAVGYDTAKPINGIWNGCYGGNVNTAYCSPGLRGVMLTNPSMKPDAQHFGSMFLGTLFPNAQIVPTWDNVDRVWQDFEREGVIRGSADGPSKAGRTWNAAVVAGSLLLPRESVTIPIIWTWHFPNHFVWWEDREGQPRIGRMYSNWFLDARNVAEYVATNYQRLATDTEKFRRTFYRATLPYWMLHRIGAQSSTLVSSVCMWLEDGTFAAFEGGPGCCPMNCTHVFNYEMQIAHLFPALERNMRHTDLEVQQMPNGGIRHRTRLPLSLPREHGPFVDGHLGCILKAYREHRLSTSREWLDKMWPRIKLAMDFVLKEWDRNQDGVLVNEQWNTYDAAMYGPNTFIGTLYLCALRAAVEMARMAGEEDYANRLHEVFNLGSKRLDNVLWNGEYYFQIESKPTEAQVGEHRWLLEDWPEVISDNPSINRPYGMGCHADQLLGQWWAYALDLGYLLPRERVCRALDSIMKYNWVVDFGAVLQSPRYFAGDEDHGLYNCTWPGNDKPATDTLYSFEVWTGIEYEVAAMLLREGKIRDAYRIVKAVSDRYNGVRRWPIARNPWAEVECGNHYARAMSAWAILLAAQGFSYNGPDMAIAFDPVIAPKNHRSFFTGAEGWGVFTQTRVKSTQTNTLSIEYGKLVLKRFTVSLPDEVEPERVRTKIKGTNNNYTLQLDGRRATIVFTEPVQIKAGSKVGFRFYW